MDYILDFSDLDKSSLPLVGGKNASLGEMINAGIRVPPGFAVTTDTYLNFITEARIREKISDILSELNPDDVKTLDNSSGEVRELIKSAPIPDEIQKSIGNAMFYPLRGNAFQIRIHHYGSLGIKFHNFFKEIYKIVPLALYARRR